MNRLSSIPHPPSVTSLLASAFSALLAPVQNLLPEHVNRPQINALDIRTLFSLHLPPSAARRGWPLSVCKFLSTLHYTILVKRFTGNDDWKLLSKEYQTTQPHRLHKWKEDLFVTHSLGLLLLFHTQTLGFSVNYAFINHSGWSIFQYMYLTKNMNILPGKIKKKKNAFSFTLLSVHSTDRHWLRDSKEFLYCYNNIMIRAACKIPGGWLTCGRPTVLYLNY